jgi:hypothetical protein
MCRVEIHELHPYPESVRVPEDGSDANPENGHCSSERPATL